MIVVPQPPASNLETASVSTLAVDGNRPERPQHLVKLVSASLLVALAATIFTVVDHIIRPQEPKTIVPIVLAFVLTLPHHGGTLLLAWLQRYQSDSILPFKPYSTHGVAYSILLLMLWIASTIERSISLSRILWHDLYIAIQVIEPNGAIGETGNSLNADIVWAEIVSTVTSSMEVILMSSITLMCLWHNRRDKKPSSALSTPVPRELKALEA